MQSQDSPKIAGRFDHVIPRLRELPRPADHSGIVTLQILCADNSSEPQLGSHTSPSLSVRVREPSERESVAGLRERRPTLLATWQKSRLGPHSQQWRRVKLIVEESISERSEIQFNNSKIIVIYTYIIHIIGHIS